MQQVSTDIIDQFNSYAQDYYLAKEYSKSTEASRLFEELGFDSYGMDTIGSGCGRIVCDMDILGYPSLCVKFAIPNYKWDGLNQNMYEVDVWQQIANKSQKDYLTPIVVSDSEGYWNIMKKGTEPSQNIHQWKQQADYELRNIVWSDDLIYDHIVEIDGQLTYCDYGVPPQ